MGRIPTHNEIADIEGRETNTVQPQTREVTEAA